MAGLAVDTELAAMYIRMTIGAVDSNVRKHEGFMALSASCRSMCTDERETGDIMIKFHILFQPVP